MYVYISVVSYLCRISNYIVITETQLLYSFRSLKMPDNVMDAITFEEILPERLVTIQSGDNIYHFDVNTLYRAYADNAQKYPTNPFTRERLNPESTKKVLAYGDTLKVVITYCLKSFTTENYKSIGYVVCKMLSSLTFIDTDWTSHGKSIYDKDLEKDIIGADTHLLACAFATTELKYQALGKLRDYTADKLWDAGTNNYNIHNLALQSLTVRESIRVWYLNVDSMSALDDPYSDDEDNIPELREIEDELPIVNINRRAILNSMYGGMLSMSAFVYSQLLSYHTLNYQFLEISSLVTQNNIRESLHRSDVVLSVDRERMLAQSINSSIDTLPQTE